MTDDGTLTTNEVVEVVGATYRQLDYWVRAGYLPMDDPMPGSGAHRHWTPRHVQLARVFLRLSDGLGIPPGVVSKSLDTLALGPDSFAIWLGSTTVSGPLP